MESSDTTYLRELLVANLPAIDRLIEFVCRRNRLEFGEADDFASLVKLKLVDDDYAILRKFQGRSALGTYLNVVIQRLFLDYRNEKWGKWRPSAHAKRYGDAGVALDTFIHRDGLTLDDAVARVARDAALGITEDEARKIAATLPAREPRPHETDLAHVDREVSIAGRSVEENAARSEAAAIATSVRGCLERVTATLDAESRLVMKLRYRDMLAVADIARLTGADQRRLYRRIDAVLARFRQELERSGITWDVAAAVLQEDLDLTLMSEENERNGPSTTTETGLRTQRTGAEA